MCGCWALAKQEDEVSVQLGECQDPCRPAAGERLVRQGSLQRLQADATERAAVTVEDVREESPEAGLRRDLRSDCRSWRPKNESRRCSQLGSWTKRVEQRALQSEG